MKVLATTSSCAMQETKPKIQPHVPIGSSSLWYEGKHLLHSSHRRKENREYWEHTKVLQSILKNIIMLRGTPSCSCT